MAIISVPLVDGFLVERSIPGARLSKREYARGCCRSPIGGEDFCASAATSLLKSTGSLSMTQEDLARLVGSLKVGDSVQLTLYHEKRHGRSSSSYRNDPFSRGICDPASSGTLLPMVNSLVVSP